MSTKEKTPEEMFGMTTKKLEEQKRIAKEVYGVAEEKEKVCRFGHICTSDCGNTKECACLSDHCCAMTLEMGLVCEGGEHCDDHYQEKSLLTNLREAVDMKPMEFLGK